MLKTNNTKYRLNRNKKTYYLNLKELKNRAGNWITDSVTGIKYKSIIVDYLDTKSNKIISERKAFGKVKISFFRYPNVRKFKAIASTDLELTAMEILSHYLKRWSIECMFKDIKQSFGYSQNKASKYSSLIGDISIRYAFYIMFSYKKEQAENKTSTEQLLLEFYQEIFEISLNQFIEMMFKQKLKQFLEYAKKIGIKSIEETIIKVDNLIERFFKTEHDYDKIEVLTDKLRNKRHGRMM